MGAFATSVTHPVLLSSMTGTAATLDRDLTGLTVAAGFDNTNLAQRSTLLSGATSTHTSPYDTVAVTKFQIASGSSPKVEVAYLGGSSGTGPAIGGPAGGGAANGAVRGGGAD